MTRAASPCTTTMSKAKQSTKQNSNRAASSIDTGYGAFLSRLQWSYFSTLTFRTDLSVAAIRRAMERHFERIRPRIAFWVHEVGSVESKAHVHAVYQMTDQETTKLSKSEIGLDWSNRNGFADVRDYDGSLGGCDYICKSIGSDAPDYDIWYSSGVGLQQNATD